MDKPGPRRFIFPALLIAGAASAFACSGDFFGSEADLAQAVSSAQVPEAPAPAAKTWPQSLPPAEAAAYIRAENPVVLDIRTPEEVAAGRIAGSAAMDFYAPDFQQKLAALDRKGKYLLYCRSGRRSAKALEAMAALGFSDFRHIEGGITAWSAAGLPVEK